MGAFEAAVAAALALMSAATLDGRGMSFALRQSIAPEAVRIVVQLPTTVETWRDESTPTKVSVRIPLPLPASLPEMLVDDPVVRRATLVRDAAGMALLTITQASARKHAITYLPPDDDNPPRLVVEVRKRYRDTTTETLAPGVVYQRIEEQTDDAFRVVHVVAAAPDAGARIVPIAAKDFRETVVTLAKRTGALAALNGGFFLSTPQRPVGLLKVSGAVYALPLWRRAAIAFPDGGTPVIGHPTGVWRLTLPDGTAHLLPDWLEESDAPTPWYAAIVNGNSLGGAPNRPGGFTVLVRDGLILCARCAAGSLSLAPGDFVVTIPAGPAPALLGTVLEAGMPVDISPVLSAPFDAFPDGLGGGPRLVRAGAVSVEGATERFQPDVRFGARARSAFALTATGRSLLVTVEPPGPYGGGMDLDSLATWLRSIGAVDALNLDGGGSAQMVVGARLVNLPSATWQRPVASALVVLPK